MTLGLTSDESVVIMVCELWPVIGVGVTELLLSRIRSVGETLAVDELANCVRSLGSSGVSTVVVSLELTIDLTVGSVAVILSVVDSGFEFRPFLEITVDISTSLEGSSGRAVPNSGSVSGAAVVLVVVVVVVAKALEAVLVLTGKVSLKPTGVTSLEVMGETVVGGEVVGEGLLVSTGEAVVVT